MFLYLTLSNYTKDYLSFWSKRFNRKIWYHDHKVNTFPPFLHEMAYFKAVILFQKKISAGMLQFCILGAKFNLCHILFIYTLTMSIFFLVFQFTKNIVQNISFCPETSKYLHVYTINVYIVTKIRFHHESNLKFHELNYFSTLNIYTNSIPNIVAK